MRLPDERPQDAEWTGVRTHDVIELWDHSIAPHVACSYKARLELVTSLVEQVTGSSGRVLDVGCAQGTVGLLLAERGLEVTLLDIRKGHIDYARARQERGKITYFEGFLGPKCPPDADFDVVLCTEVVEHVPSPAALLSDLASKTRPGGAIVLTTPNADAVTLHLPSYARAAQGVIDGAEVNSADGDAHRFLYTREELVTIVRSVGLKVERTGYLLPFWVDGHVKTHHFHRVYYSLRKRLLPLSGTLRPAALARRLCTSQWMLARRPG